MASTTKQRTLRIEYVPLDDIKRAARNPKDHDKATIRASILRHGLGDVAGIIDERTGRLVAGHGRVEVLTDMRDEALKAPQGVHVDDEGRWTVPLLYGARWKNAAEAEAFLIGHNRTTELGGWTSELQVVLADHRDRLEGTGYTIGDTARPEPEPDPDPDPEPTGFEPITQAGDLWQIGPHSLICGSSADLATITEMLGTRRVNLAVTSPPYADRRDYDPSSGFRPIPPDEYVTWFAPIAANVAAVLTPDGSWVVNIKPGSDGLDRELYVFDLVLAHARDWGWHFAEEYCWERGGVPRTPSRRLRNGFEPVFQFTRGEWKWRPDHVRHHSDHVPVPVGSGGKAAGGMGSTAKLQGVQGEEWFADRNEPGLAYPNNRLPTFSGSHEATGHNAAYPIGLPQFFVELLTDPGDLVLDPFSGSGSTILAAHRTDRVGVGVELSPAYVDVALARIQHHTGLTPTRAGEPHDLLAHTGWRPTRERGTDG